MTRLPAEGRQGEAPAWPLRPDRRLAQALQDARDQRLVLEGSKARGAVAKLARVDQLIAGLEHEIAARAEVEAELWAQLWLTPQAVMWERLRWTRSVAQYVRWKAAAELGDLDASKEARQLEDRLGLSPLALLRLRWEIVADELAARREPAPEPSGTSTRRRLKVVDPGAVAGA